MKRRIMLALVIYVFCVMPYIVLAGALWSHKVYVFSS